MGLAVSQYRSAGGLRDDGTTLGLSWTSDERQALSLDLDALVRRWLADELTSSRRAVDTYPVDDPYGERVVLPAVESWLGCGVGTVIAGAGVGSLLHAVARSATGDVIVVGTVYPDFPHWLSRSARTVTTVARDVVLGGAVTVPPAGIVFLERPSILGDSIDSLAELRRVCERAAQSGATVVVDESNANYEPPRYSAATILESCENLVVLRGLSKAYGLGGLRVGLALAGTSMRSWMTDAIPPLQASPASLQLASRVLRAGDVAEPLRRIVALHKRVGGGWLSEATGLAPRPGHRGLPYWLYPPQESTVRALRERGVVGKSHVCWRGRAEGGPRTVHRLSVPVDPARLDRLRALCQGPRPDVDERQDSA